MNNEHRLDTIGDFMRYADNSSDFVPPKLTPHVPSITADDIDVGYIDRYFVKFFNHRQPMDIIEVSEQTYAECSNNAFFRCCHIRWLISGKIDDEYGLNPDGTKIRLYTGVKTANEQEIQLKATVEFPLSQILSDPLQFYFNDNNSRL